MREVRLAIAIVGAIVAIGYLVLIAPFLWNQRSLVYWSTSDPGLGSADGMTLQRYPATRPGTDDIAYVHEGRPGMPTLVYLHGRGESLGIARGVADDYIREGWTVIVPEYPGFGMARGTPGEASIGELMDDIHDDLAMRGVDPRTIAIQGNSLGAGPALQLAQHPHGFLLLTAPVGSMAEVVHTYVPFIPSFMLRDGWDNFARARTRYPARTLVVQAEDDEVVPIDQGRRLAAAAHARFHAYPEGGHMIVGRPVISYGPHGFSARP